MDISENVLRIWKCAKRNKQALTSGESEVGMWIWSRLVLGWAGQRDINDSWSRLSFTRARKAPSLAHLKSSPPAPSAAEALRQKAWSREWTRDKRISVWFFGLYCILPRFGYGFLEPHQLISLRSMQLKRAALSDQGNPLQQTFMSELSKFHSRNSS